MIGQTWRKILKFSDKQKKLSEEYLPVLLSPPNFLIFRHAWYVMRWDVFLMEYFFCLSWVSIEIACPPTEQHQTRFLKVIRFGLRKYFDQPSKLKSANVPTYMHFGSWKKHVLQHSTYFLKVVRFAAANEVHYYFLWMSKICQLHNNWYY